MKIVKVNDKYNIIKSSYLSKDWFHEVDRSTLEMYGGFLVEVIKDDYVRGNFLKYNENN